MKRFVSSIFLAVLMASFVVLPNVASAGTTYTYVRGGAAEFGTGTPCGSFSPTPGANDQPSTLATCTIGQYVYYHVSVPADYSAANTAGNLYIDVEYYPEADSTASHYACFEASITAWPIGSYSGQNYKTQSLGTLGGTNIPSPTTSTAFNPTDTLVALTNIYDAHTGTYCSGAGACTSSDATIRLHRIACTGQGQTDVSGGISITQVWMATRN